MGSRLSIRGKKGERLKTPKKGGDKQRSCNRCVGSILKMNALTTPIVGKGKGGDKKDRYPIILLCLNSCSCRKDVKISWAK